MLSMAIMIIMANMIIMVTIVTMVVMVIMITVLPSQCAIYAQPYNHRQRKGESGS